MNDLEWPLTVLPRRVTDARAAASDTQHWGRVCLPSRQCTSTPRSWHSRVHHSWHVARQQSWQKLGWLLNLEHDAEACIKYQSAIRTRCGDGLLRHGLNFSTAWWTVRLISDIKDWNRVAIHADAGHFEHLLWRRLRGIQVATQHNSPFQSHQRLEENNTVSIRRLSSAFHKLVRWHLLGVMSKFTITVTVCFILR